MPNAQVRALPYTPGTLVTITPASTDFTGSYLLLKVPPADPGISTYDFEEDLYVDRSLGSVCLVIPSDGALLVDVVAGAVLGDVITALFDPPVGSPPGGDGPVPVKTKP